MATILVERWQETESDLVFVGTEYAPVNLQEEGFVFIPFDRRLITER